MTRPRINRAWLAALGCWIGLVIGFPATAEAETTLQRVLSTIARTPLVSADSIIANIAETFSRGLTPSPRTLTAGDRVIIGYDPFGNPVETTADVFGLTVTGDQASALGAGVPPGFYPAGSRLFALPTSVQLSLFETDADGGALGEARVLTESRIDGSITNRINRVIPDDLSRVASVALDETAQVTVGMIGATALGSTNAGTIVTDVLARYDPDASRTRIDLAMAEAAIGAAGAMRITETTTAMAREQVSWTAGGSADNALAMLNISSSRMDVTGAVATIVRQQSLRIETVTTTVLGALNGGQIVAE